MKRALWAISMTMLLNACMTTSVVHTLENDQRVDIAQRLEDKGQLADALVQWQILSTLYPKEAVVQNQMARLQNLIDERKLSLVQILNDTSTSATGANSKARKRTLLQVLALTPNDQSIKESLRDIVWENAVEDATEKTETIVAYFEENQAKAQKSIELANLIEQGESFIESEKYNGLLQLADRLQEISPGHKNVKKYKFVALNNLGQEQLKNKKYVTAIDFFEQALDYSAASSQQKLNKQIAEIRENVAEQYFRQGQKAFKQDLSEAISLFKQALEVFPAHAKANQQLGQAEKIQTNLQRIKRLNNE